MQQQDLIGILDTIEREDFLALTFIASGYEMVARILSETSEVKFLLDHKRSSLPLMRARYKEQGTEMPDRFRLVYFVIFGLAGDRAMVRDIISYLKGCRALPIGSLLSPWHPFLHGVQALVQISGGQVQAPSSSVVVDKLDEFLDRVKSWEAQISYQG